MLDIKNKTIGSVFSSAASLWPDSIFFISPGNNSTEKSELSYSVAATKIKSYENYFSQSGYGYGERIALLLGNSVEHYLVKLAANNLGISVVPLNPDSSKSEIIYILNDSNSVLLITNKNHSQLASSVKDKLETSILIVNIEEFSKSLPASKTPIQKVVVTHNSEASLLYTSGTTGKPKGCILSHEYELMCGDSYRSAGPPVGLKVNQDRVYNPLPSFHINAGILTLFGCILTGNCLIQPARFSLKTWWMDIKETQATVFHYLGVIIAVLLQNEKTSDIKPNSLRLGLGAGVEPTLHKSFEKKYKIPLIEVWGMTEMCRILTANEEPRMIHTRAMGKPRLDLEIKVVDDNDKDVPIGTEGEMLVRYSAENPRKGAFSGYLGNENETEVAWRGGWFHTGDTVVMDSRNILYFVDRKKNIIRRSGENIAAAEIENCMMEHSSVLEVACLAAPDDIREEEVLACIVLRKNKLSSYKTAKTLFNHVYNRLAYFKAPGWILFVEKLPITGTQKILKHNIFEKNENPLERPGIIDLRKLKIRKTI